MELHSHYDPLDPNQSIFDVQKRVAKDFTVRFLCVFLCVFMCVFMCVCILFFNVCVYCGLCVLCVCVCVLLFIE
jgi:hypothetical protein